MRRQKADFICIDQEEQKDRWRKSKVLSSQQKLAQVYEKCLKSKTLIFYEKVKYQQVVYQQGDFIELIELHSKVPLVVKLRATVKAPDQIVLSPFLEVQWCLRKDNLQEDKIKMYTKHISEAEVFPSPIKFYICIESVKCKCTVLSVEEYGILGLATQHIYFTRANYDEITNTLVPPPSKWSVDCICRMPTNPDLQYIQCAKCTKWLHLSCVNADSDFKRFVCPQCNPHKN